MKKLKLDGFRDGNKLRLENARAIGFSSIWTAVTAYIINIYFFFNPVFILMGTQGLVTLFILVHSYMHYTPEISEIHVVINN